MFEAILLLGLLLLIQGVIISSVLMLYTGTPFGESWSWAWSKAWVPIVFTISALLGAL